MFLSRKYGNNKNIFNRKYQRSEKSSCLDLGDGSALVQALGNPKQQPTTTKSYWEILKHRMVLIRNSTLILRKMHLKAPSPPPQQLLM